MKILLIFCLILCLFKVKFGISVFVEFDSKYNIFLWFNWVILVMLVGLFIGVKLNLKFFVWIILFLGVLIIMLYVFGILCVVR